MAICLTPARKEKEGKGDWKEARAHHQVRSRRREDVEFRSGVWKNFILSGRDSLNFGAVTVQLHRDALIVAADLKQMDIGQSFREYGSS